MSAMLIAIIFVAIYFISIPNGLGGAIHFGDSLVFISATLLPMPYSLLVAALGPGLFNLARMPMWLPFTIVIKPIMALCFTSKGESILGPLRNRIAPFLAGVINTVLYFFAYWFLLDGWESGVAALPGLVIQGAGSIVFFFLIAVALDRLKLKKMLML